MLYKKKTGDAISRRHFMFQLAIELREAHIQGKTAPLAAVLLPLFNNSYQNSIVHGTESESKAKLMQTVNKTKLQIMLWMP